MPARLLQTLASLHSISTMAHQCQRLTRLILRPLSKSESAACHNGLTIQKHLDSFFPNIMADSLNKPKILEMSRIVSDASRLFSLNAGWWVDGKEDQPSMHPFGTHRNMPHRPNLLYSKWFMKAVKRYHSSVSNEALVPKQDLPQVKRPLKASRTRQPSRTNLPDLSVNEVKYTSSEALKCVCPVCPLNQCVLHCGLTADARKLGNQLRILYKTFEA